MGTKAAWPAFALVAIVTSIANAQNRECPIAFNQTVVVRANTAKSFRLNIQNDNSQPITIFQYPELGQLIPAGTSPLDYVFLPNSRFGGTTYASYRINQPNQCTGGVQTARVTFVVEGPPAAVVLSGDAVFTRDTLCGSVSIPVAIPAVSAMWLVGRGRRRKPA